ncbi:hypothetical protein [Leptolyngbya sp. FACHB-261]|uniref:hypothetical protein n=1 Tax=Leptolyngbya sp. FACHB-261 TaxID=2692806 RepID=UPI001686538A|nr:hypothetical protein [Leptolyngbya sp. FACHB-261]MBD2099911.1 hypothetical protein [Leptolyngbya sp. FACHB-261]
MKHLHLPRIAGVSALSLSVGVLALTLPASAQTGSTGTGSTTSPNTTQPSATQIVVPPSGGAVITVPSGAGNSGSTATPNTGTSSSQTTGTAGTGTTGSGTTDINTGLNTGNNGPTGVNSGNTGSSGVNTGNTGTTNVGTGTTGTTSTGNTGAGTNNTGAAGTGANPGTAIPGNTGVFPRPITPATLPPGAASGATGTLITAPGQRRQVTAPRPGTDGNIVIIEPARGTNAGRATNTAFPARSGAGSPSTSGSSVVNDFVTSPSSPGNSPGNSSSTSF